jgi:predicted nucleic acid-binding protein
MNYEQFERKHLLLDTNVLINFTKHPLLMEGMLAALRAKGAILVLDEVVRFEFLREANSPKEIQTLKYFLQKLFELKPEDVDRTMFPIVPDIFTYATEIGNLYSWKKYARISLADCFLAAQMRKYNEKKEQMYLMTSDHTDFPPLFFERIGIETLDAKDSIINVGFYRFDPAAFSACQASYETQK